MVRFWNLKILGSSGIEDFCSLITFPNHSDPDQESQHVRSDLNQSVS